MLEFLLLPIKAPRPDVPCQTAGCCKGAMIGRAILMFHLVISQGTSAVPGPCLSPGKICLTGGEELSGNVLVGGRPVCDDLWGIEDATVACRNLGHARATNFTMKSFYGQLGSNFAMDDVQELASIYQ